MSESEYCEALIDEVDNEGAEEAAADAAASVSELRVPCETDVEDARDAAASEPPIRVFFRFFLPRSVFPFLFEALSFPSNHSSISGGSVKKFVPIFEHVLGYAACHCLLLMKA